MYIGEIMRTELITVSPDTTLVEARKILERHKIDHLLVVNDKKKLVGILSDRDLKQNWASPATSLSTHELNYLLEKVLVKMIMIKSVETVPASTTIERAAYIMQQKDINCLPVVDQENLVGIITSTDVMEVLLNAIGLSEGSIRLAIFVRDSIGALAAVTSTLSQERINIQSLLTWPLTKYKGVLQLVVRVPAVDGEKAMAALRARGLKVKNSYVQDIGPYIPDEQEKYIQ